MEIHIADGLLNTYDANTWLLNRLTAEVTHSESLVSPTPEINCMNWILGHALAGRHEALELLGSPAFWHEEQLSLYRTGSDPLTGEATALDFIFLGEELQRSQVALAAALERNGDDQLQVVVETRRGEKPVWKHIDGLGWHETFHVGQVDILRAYAHPD